MRSGLVAPPALAARLPARRRARLAWPRRWRFGLRAGASRPILGSVMGDEFAAVLEAARQGSEEAFCALWQDANPPLLRYLRVIAPATAEDVAAETWVHVVRGLTAFRGDEAAWRAWLVTTARRRGIEYARRS